MKDLKTETERLLFIKSASRPEFESFPCHMICSSVKIGFSKDDHSNIRVEIYLARFGACQPAVSKNEEMWISRWYYFCYLTRIRIILTWDEWGNGATFGHLYVNLFHQKACKECADEEKSGNSEACPTNRTSPRTSSPPSQEDWKESAVWFPGQELCNLFSPNLCDSIK